MKVECKVEHCQILVGNGVEAPAVCVTCARCRHEATVRGDGQRSITRALMSLRDDCPEGEENYYVAEDEGGESPMPTPAVKPWWQK